MTAPRKQRRTDTDPPPGVWLVSSAEGQRAPYEVESVTELAALLNASNATATALIEKAQARTH